MHTKSREPADESSDLRSVDISDTGRPVTSGKRTGQTATITTTPDIPPPSLICPNCDAALAYRQTVISGVQSIERWDYFKCGTCGPFVYRDRTRQLRPAT